MTFILVLVNTKYFYIYMIPIEKLLEAGVHFGHRVNKWNPKMAPYIFGERNGVHIIDLIQTLGYLEESYVFLSKYTPTKMNPKDARGMSRGGNDGRDEQSTSRLPSQAKGGPSRTQILENGIGAKVLFVGTKKQVSSIIQLEAENSQANYVNHRWLGGLLTNWSTIKLCIAKLKTLRASGLFDNTDSYGSSSARESDAMMPASSPQLPSEAGRSREEALATASLFATTKKEKALLKKQYEKLKKFFGGIETMNEIPDIVIIVGQDCEMNAVKECQKLASSWRRSDAQPSAGKFETSKASNFKNQPLPRTITILDTNCDPSLADLFIPANDDSTKSIELILQKLGEAIRLPR